MQSLFVNSVFGSKVTKALCWMLVHSLWQGLLLAAVVAGIIWFTKKSTAALRYNLLVAAFLFFIISAGITFYVEFTSGTSGSLSQGPQTVATPVIINNALPVTTVTANNDLPSLLVGFFNEQATLIVYCWCLFILLQSIKLGVGLYGIHRIRTRKLVSVGSYWNLRLQQLATGLQVKDKVRFYQSALVKVPMVAGHFKPVIFFPLGALANLSPGDVEAVLLHELAHIRRKDYAVNLLQHIAEIIFFFNPAVVWVSELIKSERENCCDDIALSQNADKKTYVNALVSFREMETALPLYATALTGNNHQLLNRIKRILGDHNKSLSRVEKTFLVVCLVITGMISLMFSQRPVKPVPAALPAQKSKLVQSATTTTTTTTTTIADTAAPKSYHRMKKNGVVYEVYGDITWFRIDGKKIPKAEWGHYKAIIYELMHDTKATTAAVSPGESIDPVLVAKEMAHYDSIAYEYRKQAKLVDEQAAKYKTLPEPIPVPAIPAKPETPGRAERANPVTHRRMNAETTVRSGKQHILTGITYSADAEAPVNVKAMTEEVVELLLQQRIISSKTDLSYQLNNESFIVNGKVQPESLHKSLKDKYIKSADWQLLYNWTLKQ